MKGKSHRAEPFDRQRFRVYCYTIVYNRTSLQLPHGVPLREELGRACVSIVVLLQDLADGHLKVVLGDVLPALAESVHPCFLADTAHLGTGALTRLLGKSCQWRPVSAACENPRKVKLTAQVDASL